MRMLDNWKDINWLVHFLLCLNDLCEMRNPSVVSNLEKYVYDFITGESFLAVGYVAVG